MNDIWSRITAGIVLDHPSKMHEVGLEIGRQIEPNQTLSLEGNLGDGKTTLSKGIAAGWGVKTTVKSPTFNYFLTYEGERGLLVHLDAYRLGGPEEYESLMLEEILTEPWLLLVEWPDRVTGCLPQPNTTLRLESIDESTRRLSMKDSDPFGSPDS